MADRFDHLNKPGAAGHGRTGWAVGRFDWLNNPDSKVNRYWRVIEEGSAATKWPWEGKRIPGLWGNNAGPRGNLIRGQLSGFGEQDGNQKFVPFFPKIGENYDEAARRALIYFMEAGHGPNMEKLRVSPSTSRHPGGHFNPDAARRRLYFWLISGQAQLDQMPFVQGVVIKPVEARHFYQRAMASFDPMAVQMEELRRGVAGMLTGVDVTTRAGLATARETVAADTGSYKGVRRPLAPGQAIGLTPAAKTGRARTYVHTAALPASLAQVTARAEIQDFLRDGKGRFSNGAWLDMMQDINRNVAKRFQDHLVEMMKSERKRPPSEQLTRATEDPRNRYPQ